MNRRPGLAFLGLASAVLAACGSPAVVLVSPDYNPAQVRRVALAGFADFPGAAGSGEMAAGAFEKYLLLAGYRLVERRQAVSLLRERDLQLSDDVDPGRVKDAGRILGVDALVFGSLTDFKSASEQTVMVDMPHDEVDPLYGQISTTRRVGDARVTTVQNVVTGYATTRTDVVVPQTQFLPASAGVSARLVDARSGEVLWSVSAAGDGDSLGAALETASSRAMQAVAKRLGPTAAR